MKTITVWEVGDEVVSLKTETRERYQPLLKDARYIVKAVRFCPTSGRQYVNVGFQTTAKLIDCNCGQSHDTYGLHWSSAKSFKSIFEEAKSLEDTVDKLKKEIEEK